jgi:hypothetical protein
VWPHGKYFHDMTCEGINIRTNDSQLFDEQRCFLTLICIEECDGLKYRMKQRVCDMEFDLP